jgi:hypothetical protein
VVKKIFIALVICLGVFTGFGQEENTPGKRITIVYGGTFTKNESKLPGASIFSKDARQVQFEHQGADLWCDYALLYQQENRLEAIGNVRLEQGDSVVMTGGYIEYFGNQKLAKTSESVTLTNRTMSLSTDTLFFDREKQEAYYNYNGRIVDSVNTLTSRVGRYDMIQKKYQFEDSVLILNPDYTLNSTRLDYYTSNKKAYMYGPSTIEGEDYTMYCERGFYDTASETGYGIKNTEIHYSNRIIEGDSIYFNKATEFASATNNIVITDTINDGVIRAHYAEVHRARDSVFATKRALSISLVEQDSLYLHGDTLMVTGPADSRIIRAFRDARFFKKDLSGKSDSIHFEEQSGITRLIRRPVLWNLENQLTGDSILLLSNRETEQMDSLKVLGNAFLISEDTLGHRGYNQAKGKNLFGKFLENELRTADLIGNTEVVYYLYDDKDELVGINKTICSKIRLNIENSDIEDIIFYTNPDGKLYPEWEFPNDSRLLEGFIWRGDERIFGPQDLFSSEDNNLTLPVIKGLTQEIDPLILFRDPLPQKGVPQSIPKKTRGNPAKPAAKKDSAAVAKKQPAKQQPATKNQNQTAKKPGGNPAKPAAKKDSAAVAKKQPAKQQPASKNQSQTAKKTGGTPAKPAAIKDSLTEAKKQPVKQQSATKSQIQTSKKTGGTPAKPAAKQDSLTEAKKQLPLSKNQNQTAQKQEVKSFNSDGIQDSSGTKQKQSKSPTARTKGAPKDPLKAEKLKADSTRIQSEKDSTSTAKKRNSPRNTSNINKPEVKSDSLSGKEKVSEIKSDKFPSKKENQNLHL